MTGKKLTRLLSLLLTVALMFSLVALPVYAGDADDGADSGETAAVSADAEDAGEADNTGGTTDNAESADTPSDAGADDASESADSAEADGTDDGTAEETDEAAEGDSAEDAAEADGTDDSAEEEPADNSSESDASDDSADDAGDDATDDVTEVTVEYEAITLTATDYVATVTDNNGDTSFTDLKAAFDYVTGTATITLLCDTSISYELVGYTSNYTSVTQNITLELGNYTLTISTEGMYIGVNSGSSLTINATTGGIVATGAAPIHNCGGTLVINGGIYTGSNYEGAVYVEDKTTAVTNITGGSFTSTGSSGAAIVLLDGTTTISGGTFTSSTTNSISVSSGAAVSISDGSFTGSLSVETGSTVSITGGTYSSDVSAYVADGYAYNSDGTVSAKTTTYVAQDGNGNQYATLAEAVAAANAATSDVTITLLDDIEIDEGQIIFDNSSAAITLDLNGKTISRGESTYYALTVVQSGTTLTVQDSSEGATGKIDATFTSSTSTTSYAIWNEGTLNIASGTFAGRRAIYGTTGTLNISGGTISGAYIGVMASDSMDVNISGGTITGSSHSGVYMSSTGTLKITGGTISSKYSVNVLAGTLEIDGESVSIGGTYGVWCQGTSVVATIKSGKIEGETGGVMAFSGANVTIGTQYSTTGPAISGSYEAVEISTSNSATAPAIVKVYSGTLSGTSYGICIYGKNSSSDCYSQLYVYGGSISATSYFAITGNGSTGQGYTEIYIYGGEITSTNGQAIYHPQQDGTLYVYGGTITGDTGIEVRGGTVVIEDQTEDNSLTIKATGTPTTSDPNYSGSTTSGAAVAVAPYNLSNISVSINSGTLTGETAVTVVNPNDVTDWKYTTTVAISGGKLTGAVTENIEDTLQISGGSFSTAVNAAYCAVGFIPVTEADSETSLYTVTEGSYIASVTDDNGTTCYETLDEALTYANALTDVNSVTVTLLADVTYSETKSQPAIDTAIPFTLELNGHNITFENTYSYVYIKASCTDVTIQNSSSTESTISNTNSTTSSTYALYTYASNNTFDTTITVKNVTLTSKAYNTIGLYNANATLTLENCNVSTNGSSRYGLYGYQGNVTVTSGTIDSVYAVVSSYTYIFGTEGGSADDLKVTTFKIQTAGNNLTIKSGTYSTITGTISDATKIDSKTAKFYTVSGCTLPGGYTWTESTEESGRHIITELDESNSVAKIVTTGDESGTAVYYDSLANATKAAVSGQTVVLLADYTGTTYVQTTYDGVTIDLNGHNITNTGTSSNGALYAYASKSNGDDHTITIKNSSSTESTIKGVACAVYGSTLSTLANDVKLVIDTTNLTLTQTGNGSGYSTVGLSYHCYMEDTEANEALVTNGGFAVTAGDNDKRIYGLFAYAANAAEVTGGTATVTLLHDFYGASLATSSVTTSANTVVFNMGGNKWTFSASGSSIGNPAKIINISDNRSYQINNGSFTASGKYVCAVYIYNSATCKANLTLTEVNMTLTNSTAYYFGLVTNGSTGNEHTIVLDNSTIDAQYCDYGAYFPSAGSLTLTDGSQIIGKSTGIEIRSGSLTVTNSTVTATDSSSFSTANENSGSTVYGAGIAVSQHTTNNAINVTITNSTISGYYGIFEVNYNSSNTSKVAIDISGDNTAITGTADAVYSVSVSGAGDISTDATTNSNTKVSISGGYYSSDPTAYCAKGYGAATGEYVVDSTTYGYQVVDAVASVTTTSGETETTTSYGSLADAISAANEATADSVTVTLLKAATVDSNLTVSNTLTLELNGYDLTINSDVTLTVSSGTVVIVDSENAGLVTNDGTIKVESGTLDIRDLAYTTDSENGHGLLGKESGKISLGASATFIVPDVWATQWSSLGEWTPNWTSATSANGIFSSAEAGATVYSFGVGWKCGTSFNANSYDSNTTYWTSGETYLVEYYKTNRGGTDIDVENSTTWTYPTKSADDNLIFAGWYTEEGCTTVYEETSGVAYARFVKLSSDEEGSGVINFLGGSLKMSDDNYSTTSLRFGYEIVLPANCFTKAIANIDEDCTWSWSWTIPDLSYYTGSVDGQNWTDPENTYAEGTMPFRSNLLITGVPKDNYSTNVTSTLTVSFTTGDGTHVTATEATQQTRSVSQVASAILEDDNATEAEKAYANGILGNNTTDSGTD